MNHCSTDKKQNNLPSSASERAFETLIANVQKLSSVTPEVVENFKQLFDQEREITEDKIIDAVFPHEKESEQGSAAHQKD